MNYVMMLIPSYLGHMGTRLMFYTVPHTNLICIVYLLHMISLRSAVIDEEDELEVKLSDVIVTGSAFQSMPT